MSARVVTLPALTATIVLTVGLFQPAQAQTDAVAMAHAAAANQLGVMEYCQARGDVGSDAVAAQRSGITRLPATSANNDADEALGKQGTLAVPNGKNMTLESVASAHGTSISSMCKQMGSAALQTAKTFQQNGMAMGGMTMPKMPAMPNGMTMPTMPAIPGAPTQ